MQSHRMLAANAESLTQASSPRITMTSKCSCGQSGVHLGVAKITDLDQGPGGSIQQGILQLYVAIRHTLHPKDGLVIHLFPDFLIALHSQGVHW